MRKQEVPSIFFSVATDSQRSATPTISDLREVTRVMLLLLGYGELSPIDWSALFFLPGSSYLEPSSCSLSVLLPLLVPSNLPWKPFSFQKLLFRNWCSLILGIATLSRLIAGLSKFQLCLEHYDRGSHSRTLSVNVKAVTNTMPISA